MVNSLIRPRPKVREPELILGSKWYREKRASGVVLNTWHSRISHALRSMTLASGVNNLTPDFQASESKDRMCANLVADDATYQTIRAANRSAHSYVLSIGFAASMAASRN